MSENKNLVKKIVTEKSGKAGFFLTERRGAVELRYRPTKAAYAFYVLTVTEEGSLQTFGGIDNDTGLKVNKRGEVVVNRDPYYVPFA